jgi:hypothetical protein
VILIELVYEKDCPLVAEARACLSWALIEARVSQRWTEWSLSAPATPRRVRGFPSPSILINGRDVPASNAADASTRYSSLPTVSAIAAALKAAKLADPDVPDRRPPKRKTRQKRLR